MTRALVLALALLLAACAAPTPTMAPLPTQRPAPVLPATMPRALTLYYGGSPRCACVPMADGCYSAKHCWRALPAGAHFTLLGRPVTNYTLDPTRDLAHVAMAANPAVQLGRALPGQVAEWFGIRHGRAVLWHNDLQVESVWSNGILAVDSQREDVWCYGNAGALGGVGLGGMDAIYFGDSGGGFWVDGKLVGILSLFDPEGCGAWTVPVP